MSEQERRQGHRRANGFEVAWRNIDDQSRVCAVDNLLQGMCDRFRRPVLRERDAGIDGLEDLLNKGTEILPQENPQ